MQQEQRTTEQRAARAKAQRERRARQKQQADQEEDRDNIVNRGSIDRTQDPLENSRIFTTQNVTTTATATGLTTTSRSTTGPTPSVLDPALCIQHVPSSQRGTPSPIRSNIPIPSSRPPSTSATPSRIPRLENVLDIRPRTRKI